MPTSHVAGLALGLSAVYATSEMLICGSHALGGLLHSDAGLAKDVIQKFLAAHSISQAEILDQFDCYPYRYAASLMSTDPQKVKRPTMAVPMPYSVSHRAVVEYTAKAQRELGHSGYQTTLHVLLGLIEYLDTIAEEMQDPTMQRLGPTLGKLKHLAAMARQTLAEQVAQHGRYFPITSPV